MEITRYGDTGTPELLQRKGIEINIVEGQPRAYIKNISPIHTYFAKGQISEVQYDAGVELYRCYYNGVVKMFGTGCTLTLIERVSKGIPAEATNHQLDCYHRYIRGIRAAEDKKYPFLVLNVVCHEKPINSIFGKGGWKRKQAKEKLKELLDNIAKEYGFL